MELVSTAQFRRAMERAVAAGAYSNRLAKLVSDLANAELETSNPLLEKRTKTKKAVLLILTANRGMCGGYNSGVLRAAHSRMLELRKEFEEVELYVAGKRGVSFLKYRKIEPTRTFLNFDHKPAFEDVEVLANECLARFESGEIDRFDVVYSKFVSLSKQYPTAETLLPFGSAPTEDETGGKTEKAGKSDRTVESAQTAKLEYEFLPSPQSVLEEVVPNAFKAQLFKRFLDAAVGEQIARMVAMKAATENADAMISSLTTTFNRARQSQITNEIIEVIGGANALS